MSAPTNGLRESLAYVHKEANESVVGVEYFIIAKNWKRPKCPSVVEWLNRMDRIYFSYLVNGTL